MNTRLFCKSVSRIAAWLSISVLALGLISCGGGGGGDAEESEATVRPKTMDGIIMSLDNLTTFEFIRNTGTAAAVKNGEVETGTFLYNSGAGISIRSYNNIGGDQSTFQYPLSVSAATYTYRAINNNSGVLTLVANGVFDFRVTIPPGVVFPFNNSWIQLFFSHSPVTTIPNARLAEIDITFTDQGSFVTSDTLTLRIPNSPFVNTLDTVRIPSTITLATGGSVPLNYNPVSVERAPSKIAPASLGNRLMRATNGIPDQNKDFTIQFSSDGVLGGGAVTADSTEIGRGLLSVWDASTTPPGFTAVGIALDYTWQRTGGTDTGILVLSNIPNVPALPFASSLNGRMVLSFSGQETGSYVGTADGDTPSAADVTGSFFMPNNLAPTAN